MKNTSKRHRIENRLTIKRKKSVHVIASDWELYWELYSWLLCQCLRGDKIDIAMPLQLRQSHRCDHWRHIWTQRSRGDQSGLKGDLKADLKRTSVERHCRVLLSHMLTFSAIHGIMIDKAVKLCDTSIGFVCWAVVACSAVSDQCWANVAPAPHHVCHVCPVCHAFTVCRFIVEVESLGVCLWAAFTTATNVCPNVPTLPTLATLPTRMDVNAVMPLLVAVIT